MNTIAWVDPGSPLPLAGRAPAHGLLAAGADLSVRRLTEAYEKGIFPWFNEGDPVLWWSPDPRMVLECNALRVTRSLAKLLRKIERTESHAGAALYVTTNLVFREVIKACAAPARRREATWISSDIQDAYQAWHEVGQAHSIEVWHDGLLVGGLYGVCLGHFFFGESMFSRMNDASKVALVYLVRMLQQRGIGHIDCQQETGHLYSMGARPMSREDFLTLLEARVHRPTPAWGRGQVLQTGKFASATHTAP